MENFMQKKVKRIAIITGASSGMGWEFAYQLRNRISGIDEFWLIARRRDKLTELASVLKNPGAML